MGSSGEFIALNMFSDYLCPVTHHMAMTNHTELDLYCARNTNAFDFLHRYAAAGLYIPEFLTDSTVLSFTLYVSYFNALLFYSALPL